MGLFGTCLFLACALLPGVPARELLPDLALAVGPAARPLPEVQDALEAADRRHHQDLQELLARAERAAATCVETAGAAVRKAGVQLRAALRSGKHSPAALLAGANQKAELTRWFRVAVKRGAGDNVPNRLALASVGQRASQVEFDKKRLWLEKEIQKLSGLGKAAGEIVASEIRGLTAKLLPKPSRPATFLNQKGVAIAQGPTQAFSSAASLLKDQLQVQMLEASAVETRVLDLMAGCLQGVLDMSTRELDQITS